MVLDHVNDKNGSELHKLSKMVQLPDFVRQADFSLTTNTEGLPKTAYADPDNKLYPCHTPASTWLSAAYFAEKGEQSAEKRAQVRQRLDEFARHWRIKTAVDRTVSQITAAKTASDESLPDSDFAYVWVGENGVKDRRLRVKNANEVRAAEKWLREYRDQIPWAHRSKIAAKILEKAATYDVELADQPYVERQAGRGMCDPVKAASALRARALLAKNPQWREKIAMLAAIVAGKPRYALDPGSLHKLAGVMEDIDKAIGISQYGEHLQRPEDVLFEVSYKEASDCTDAVCPMTSGVIYEKSDFRKVSLDSLRDHFGDEFAERVDDGLGRVDPEKCAQLATTLPLGDAETFDAIAAGAGIRPVTVKAAAEARRNWQQVADVYRRQTALV